MELESEIKAARKAIAKIRPFAELHLDLVWMSQATFFGADRPSFFWGIPTPIQNLPTRSRVGAGGLLGALDYEIDLDSQ